MIEIIVRGPGGCIDVEGEIVRRALVAAGCNVSVETNHPITPAQLSAALDSLQSSYLTRFPIKLKLDHLPWGG